MTAAAIRLPTSTAEALPARAKDDPVLAAIRRAPIVPFTDEERALIAEVKGDPRTWQTTEGLMEKLAKRRSAHDDE